MGLEIELEYDDTQDGVWSAAQEVQDSGPLRARLDRHWSPGRSAGRLAGSALLVHLGIALAALALGASATAGLLAGRTAVHDRSVTLLHLGPISPFAVQALPATPELPPTVEQLLATPWTNTFDRDVSLTVVNDGPDPVTVLGATVAAMQFESTALTPASSAPTAPGGVSVLRGRAHVVCGDFPAADQSATIARLRVRAGDGLIHGETLMVDHFSEIAEQSVCQRMTGPQVVRATTFPATPTAVPGMYTAEITATNRAPFPLRMAVPQAALQNWSSGGGLELATSGDVVIPPHGTGTIAITAKVVDCPAAIDAATNHFAYDTLAFSDGRHTANYPLARLMLQALPVTNLEPIMTYCVSEGSR